MKNKVFIKPNPSKKVDGKALRLFNPDTKSEIPAEGAEVALDNYWRGMLERGQIVLLEDNNIANNANNTDLSEAIDLLKEDNEAHWTNDGKPDAKALSSILGRNVSAAERDEAWQEYNKEGE